MLWKGRSAIEAGHSLKGKMSGLNVSAASLKVDYYRLNNGNY